MTNGNFHIPLGTGDGGGDGGFTIGSSYLTASYEEIDGVTGGNLMISWNQIELVGSDLEIDGDDAAQINVLTTGWYVISGFTELSADAGGNFTQWYSQIWINGVLKYAEGEAHGAGGADVLIDNRGATPPIPLAAGDAVNVGVNGVVSDAGTFSLFSLSPDQEPGLTIVRLS